MKRSNWWSMTLVSFLAITAAVSFCTAGCSAVLKGAESPQGEPRQLHAYGGNWVFLTTNRYDSEFYLYGLAAGGTERTKHLMYLEREGGKRILLSERVYVPQREGSLKSVANCCGDPAFSDEPLQAIDGRLVLHFNRKWMDVTDCPLDGGASDKGLLITFFGEFDPVSERVVVDSYFSPSSKVAGSATSSNEPLSRVYASMYRRRSQLNCK